MRKIYSFVMAVWKRPMRFKVEPKEDIIPEVKPEMKEKNIQTDEIKPVPVFVETPIRPVAVAVGKPKMMKSS
jgi:hypothetical protein